MKTKSIFYFPALLVIMLQLVLDSRPTLAQTQQQEPQPEPQQPQTTNLNIFAATSLTNALLEIEPLYEQSRSNVDVSYNFAASGVLVNQIRQGALADAFFSAAEREIQILEDANLLLPETRTNVLNNSLAIITPLNSALSLSSVQDLTLPEVSRVAIGQATTVPAGEYAQQLLNSFGLLEQLQPKLVFGNNVRAVLSLVETGNAEAGIVYITDALQSDLVRVATIPPTDAYSPIIYPVAVLQGSPNPEVAIDFTNFLSSPTATSVFERFGFTAANTSDLAFTNSLSSIAPASVNLAFTNSVRSSAPAIRFNTPNNPVSVPEPNSAISILALGALGVGLRLKRKTTTLAKVNVLTL